MTERDPMVRLVLQDDCDDFARELLRSMDREAPRADTRRKNLAALGIGGAATTGVGGGVATKAVASGTAWLSKKVVFLGLFALGSAGAIAVAPSRSPAPVELASQATVETAQPAAATIQHAVGRAAPAPLETSQAAPAPLETAQAAPLETAQAARLEGTQPERTQVALTRAPAARPAAPPAADPATPPAAPAAPPAAVKATLTDEVTSLEQARAAVARGDHATALVLLDRYDAAQSQHALAQEALMLRIEALVALGRKDEAVILARRLLVASSGPAYESRIRTLLGTSMGASLP